MTTMLDFYRQHGVSPVTQDVSDLQAHFDRRAHLYRSLGLPLSAIRGSEVLEIGPGTGDNALYTQSLGPSSYGFVEPNESAHAMLRQRFPRAVIFEGGIEDVRILPYDVVICEGLLGLCGGDPLALLRKVISFVNRGSVLVITCIDPISDHAEVLRRALAQKYINPRMTLQEKVDALRPVFTPHLNTLKGMTRSVDDWIIDNLLNPASIGPTFSIPEALSALDGNFELLGCSPRFLMDWRWYKDATPGLQWAIDAYWEQCHNLYDYRRHTHTADRLRGKAQMHYCTLIRRDVAAMEQGRAIGVDTREIERDPGWFGRGQQYLSLVRVN